MIDKPTTTRAYIQTHPKWAVQLTAVAGLLESMPLEATIKWGAPCYTYHHKNVVGLVGFKNHCAIWFHQGALMDDPHQLLINAQPGKTQMMRQVRFRESEIPNLTILKTYMENALALVP